ncbi:MAG TPA: HAMP domain-containing sensor histidine kinase [Actinomycetes bacterium]|nr:HAMP domain-containing sensor histidine kinase [Actinomycetes bacterium]
MAVVGATMLVGALVMLAFVDKSLSAQAADAAEIRAGEVVATEGSLKAEAQVLDPTEEFVQVLRDGQVVASSENVSGLPLLASPSTGEHIRLDDVPFTNAPFIVASAAQGDLVAVVGRNIDDEVDAAATVRKALLFGVPLLLLVVGVVTWWIVGRTLRPVEDIRKEVEQISAREMSRRVPTAPGSDEITRLAATMNRMLDRLQTSQVRQRQLVSDASHELRSPVAAIRQHAEVADTHPNATNVEELASAVLIETERLQRLVEDLLLLARLDEGAENDATEIDLDDLVLAEANRLRRMTTADVDTTNVEAGRVRGDAVALERMTRNLAENAKRYSRRHIALGLSEENGQVLLSVEDDGPGIPAEDRERVLQRFVRLDESRGRKTGGVGLGLAIVREVAESHGGSCALGESRLGGLRVEIRLPTD